MPNAKFFRSLGLFVQENFLAPDFCAQLRAQASQGESKLAVVFGDNTEGALDESVRKVATVSVERSLEVETRERLLSVMPALEKHFNVSLNECQGPDFLKYGVGAFYLPHRDGSPSSPIKIAKRRVSAVIFLNSQSKEPAEGGYCGGSLTFYGLMDGPEWAKLAFPLEAETGLFVAFRSDVIHEVQPITFGERFSVVSWFTSAE